MKQETTERLNKMLKEVKSPEAEKEYLQKHIGEAGYDFFYEYYNDILAEKSLDVTAVIKHSGISRNYVYNILNGIKKNPGRDKIIALCVAAKMDFDETNRGLKIAGTGVLYAKSERDVVIAGAINNQIGDTTKLNILLDEHNLMPLDL